MFFCSSASIIVPAFTTPASPATSVVVIRIIVISFSSIGTTTAAPTAPAVVGVGAVASPSFRLAPAPSFVFGIVVGIIVSPPAPGRPLSPSSVATMIRVIAVIAVAAIRTTSIIGVGVVLVLYKICKIFPANVAVAVVIKIFHQIVHFVPFQPEPKIFQSFGKLFLIQTTVAVGIHLLKHG